MSGQLQSQMGGPAAAAGATSGKRMGGAMAGGVLGAARRMAPAAGAILGGIGVVKFGQQVLGVSGQAQRTEASLSALYDAAGHGAGEATRATSLLWDTFGRSSLGIKPFQQGAETLAYLGLNASESVGVMGFLEDAILATGGGAQEMTRVTEALTSAQNRGKATMQELNRISAAGVPILDMLSSEMGITTGEVMEMASAGEISVDDLTRVLQDVPGQWGPALQAGADEVRNTLPVAWGSAKQSIVNAIAQNIMPMVDRLAPHVVRAGDAIAAGLAMIPAVFDAVGSAVTSVRDVVAGFGERIQAVTGWMREHSTAMTVVASVIGTALLPTLVTMTVAFAQTVAGWVAAGAAATVSAARQAAAWLLLRARQIAAIAVLGVVNALTVASWVQMAAASMINAARMAASWVIAMGPVGWVIATVVALVALIVANWDTVVDWTRKAWTWVTDTISKAWTWVRDATSAAVTAVVNFFGNMRDQVVAAAGALRDQVVGAVTTLRDRVIAFFGDLRDQAVSRAQSLRDTVVSAVTNLRDRVVSLVTNLRDTAVAAAGRLRDLAVAAFTALRDRAVAAVSNLRDRVVGFFGSLRDSVTSAASSARDRVVAAFTGLRDSAVSAVTDLLSRVTSAFSSVVSAVTSAASSARQAVVDGFQRLRDGAVDRATSLVSWMQGLPGRIVGALGSVSTMLFDAGASILRGLRDGIVSMASAPVDAVKGVATKIRNLLPGSPVKEGPLRTLNRGHAGKQIVRMVADGMTSNVGVLAAAAEKAASAALFDVGASDVPALSAMRPASSVRAAPVTSVAAADVDDRAMTAHHLKAMRRTLERQAREPLVTAMNRTVRLSS